MENKKCVVCGKIFEPSYKAQECCSQKCGSIKAAKTMKNRSEIKNCKWCGNKFENDWAHRNKKYCSRKCRDAAWRKKQRAIKKKAFVEEVYKEYIYKRDNGICQICNKKINKKYKYPHPKSATIDHIVPLSKGGEHSKKNCQLAHWECNREKSNGSANSQLRLFG